MSSSIGSGDIGKEMVAGTAYLSNRMMESIGDIPYVISRCTKEASQWLLDMLAKHVLENNDAINASFWPAVMACAILLAMFGVLYVYPTITKQLKVKKPNDEKLGTTKKLHKTVGRGNGNKGSRSGSKKDKAILVEATLKPETTQQRTTNSCGKTIRGRSMEVCKFEDAAKNSEDLVKTLSSEMVQLREENAAYKANLERASAEQQDLRIKLDRAKNELEVSAQTRAHTAAAEEEEAKLQQKENNFALEKEELMKELDGAKADVAAKSKEIIELNGRLETLSADVASLVEEKQTLMGKLGELDRLQKVLQEKENVEKESEQQVKALSSQVMTVKEEKSHFMSRLEEESTKYKALRMELCRLRGALGDSEQKNESLRREKEELVERFEKAMVDKEAESNSMEELRAKIEALNGELEVAVEERKQMEENAKEQKSQFMSRLDEKSTKYEALRMELCRLRGELGDSEQKNESLRREKEELVERFEKAMVDKEAESNSMEELRAKIKALNGELEMAVEERKQMEENAKEQKSQFMSRLEEESTKYNALRIELCRLQGELGDLEQKNESLRREKEELVERFEKKMVDKEAESNGLEELRAKIEALNGELEVAVEERKQMEEKLQDQDRLERELQQKGKAEKELAEQVSALLSKMRMQADKNGQHQAVLALLQSTLKDKESAARKSANRVDALSSQVTTLQEENAQYASKLEGALSKYKEVCTELDRVRKDLEDSLQRSSARVAMLLKSQKSMEYEKAELQECLEKLKVENDTKAGDLEGLKEVVKTLRRNMEAAAVERNRLEEKLKEQVRVENDPDTNKKTKDELVAQVNNLSSQLLVLAEENALYKKKLDGEFSKQQDVRKDLDRGQNTVGRYFRNARNVFGR